VTHCSNVLSNFIHLFQGRVKERRTNTQQNALIRQLRRQLRTARQQVVKYRSTVRANQKLKRNISTTDDIVEAASKFLKGTALGFSPVS
jgi:cell shape-determining protein MreC